MVFKGNLDVDPRGLIYEAFRMDGIVIEECRAIFFDWALGAPVGDMQAHLQTLLDEYEADNEGHPMIAVIQEGLQSAKPAGRRGGRTGRMTRGQ